MKYTGGKNHIFAFFCLLGDLDVFRSDAVFWVTFCCFVLVVPILFVRWPREVAMHDLISFVLQ